MLNNRPAIKLCFKPIVARKFFPLGLFSARLIGRKIIPPFSPVQYLPGSNQGIKIVRMRLILCVVHALLLLFNLSYPSLFGVPGLMLVLSIARKHGKIDPVFVSFFPGANKSGLSSNSSRTHCLRTLAVSWTHDRPGTGA